MQKDGYIDDASVAIEISFTLFNPKFNYFISVLLLTEKSAGNLFPSRAIIDPFRLNPFKETYYGMQAVDVLRLLIQVYIVYIAISKMVTIIN